jgi:anti-sigma regulatory factor (Ser/Thr protein kinase)
MTGQEQGSSYGTSGPTESGEPLPRLVRPVRGAAFIVGGYAVTSTIWILLSDKLLVAVLPTGSAAAVVSEIKGMLFVLVTSAVLFSVILMYLQRLKRSDERFRETQAQLRVQEHAVRQGYVDMLDAVTGGKLILLTEEELKRSLGRPILAEKRLADPAQLSSARHAVAQSISELPVPDREGLILATGEALTNALKHGGGGRYGVYRSDGCLQIEVSDSGPGIDFRSLPKATLVSGYSTTNTLGLGFTVMLEVCDRVLLSTHDRGTTVVLELELEGMAPCSDEQRQTVTGRSWSQRR